MITKTFLAIALALMASGCSLFKKKPSTDSVPPANSSVNLFAFLAKASDSEIRRRAISMAKEDIKAGTPRVGWSGGIAIRRPNITPQNEWLVNGLPALNVPAGCTDPLSMKGDIFASAYNAEIIKHLPLSKPQ